VETKYVFEGLIISDVEYKSRKRCFRVEKISTAEDTSAATNSSAPPKMDSMPSLIILAYVVTEFTTIQLGSKITCESVSEKEARNHSKDADKASKTNSILAVAKNRNVTFDSIGGLSRQIGNLQSLLVCLLEEADEFSRRGLIPPRGILLYGPPGTGKTMMLKAAAAETNAKAYILDGKVLGKYQGETEAAIRKIFVEARANQPSIIFMDDVDALAPKRSQGEINEGRVVTTLLTEMDVMDSDAEDGSVARVAIVAATNRPNAIDESLRRAGRFEKELEIGIPDVDARREILGLLVRRLEIQCESGKLKDEFVAALAARTHGYVGADLEAVVRGGFSLALEKRRSASSFQDEEIELIVTESDFETALGRVKPTAMREIFIEPPKVRWSDIGGQEEVKQRLREAVEWPLTHPEVFARLGGTPRKGLLLYGPPGCSKTLTAKALATEAGLNFIAVKGPELFSMYVGESERALREVFRKARAASPSIIFFDEIDALTASRGGGASGGVQVLTTLLNEMDGIETLKNVIVLAATNRPEIIVCFPPSHIYSDSILIPSPLTKGSRTHATWPSRHNSVRWPT
jgi:AAA family ATPase